MPNKIFRVKQKDQKPPGLEVVLERREKKLILYNKKHKSFLTLWDPCKYKLFPLFLYMQQM